MGHGATKTTGGNVELDPLPGTASRADKALRYAARIMGRILPELAPVDGVKFRVHAREAGGFYTLARVYLENGDIYRIIAGDVHETTSVMVEVSCDKAADPVNVRWSRLLPCEEGSTVAGRLVASVAIGIILNHLSESADIMP